MGWLFMASKNRKEETVNWFIQSKYDLKAAKWNLEGRFYNNVCFLCQQASEKALKALVYFLGISRKRVLTHSVFELARLCSKHITNLSHVIEEARDLDLHYIPSRYPNGLVSGYPHQFYGETTAQKAIQSAEKIIDMVEKYLLSQCGDLLNAELNLF
jgi:HEPN domain-containing protein